MNVLVAMSGGVDSSVAAAVLRHSGHDVVGVTMKLWGGDSDTGCCSVADVDDARRVAQQLGIDHVVFNFADDFAAHVVEPYVDDHAAGRTPNPCIECNRHVKFARLSDRALLLGFDALATGHHARVVSPGDGATAWRLARGADRAKDQSYVLHMVGQAQLVRTLLPVGLMTKAAVREHARRLGLRTAGKADSQDVCFITSTSGRAGFLHERTSLRPGSVVDTSGQRLGGVDAVELVTLGQRKRLGVTGGGKARYVIDVDVPAGLVTVGDRSELLVGSQRVMSCSWIDRPCHGEVVAQCSAHGPSARAVLEPDGCNINVLWREPQRRVAPGQSVVFYDETDTYVLGGGTAC